MPTLATCELSLEQYDLNQCMTRASQHQVYGTSAFETYAHVGQLLLGFREDDLLPTVAVLNGARCDDKDLLRRTYEFRGIVTTREASVRNGDVTIVIKGKAKTVNRYEDDTLYPGQWLTYEFPGTYSEDDVYLPFLRPWTRHDTTPIVARCAERVTRPGVEFAVDLMTEWYLPPVMAPFSPTAYRSGPFSVLLTNGRPVRVDVDEDSLVFEWLQSIRKACLGDISEDEVWSFPGTTGRSSRFFQQVHGHVEELMQLTRAAECYPVDTQLAAKVTKMVENTLLPCGFTLNDLLTRKLDHFRPQVTRNSVPFVSSAFFLAYLAIEYVFRHTPPMSPEFNALSRLALVWPTMMQAIKMAQRQGRRQPGQSLNQFATAARGEAFVTGQRAVVSLPGFTVVDDEEEEEEEEKKEEPLAPPPPPPPPPPPQPYSSMPVPESTPPSPPPPTEAVSENHDHTRAGAAGVFSSDEMMDEDEEDVEPLVPTSFSTVIVQAPEEEEKAPSPPPPPPSPVKTKKRRSKNDK